MVKTTGIIIAICALIWLGSCAEETQSSSSNPPIPADTLADLSDEELFDMVH